MKQQGFFKVWVGTSLAVQWLRLHASTAGGMGSIPGERTRILHACHTAKKKGPHQGPYEKNFLKVGYCKYFSMDE